MEKSKHSRQPTHNKPHSWLLRLFQSEFFDVRIAVLYLFKYSTVIGIQNYICQELYKFQEKDFNCILSQLCHFLITQPSQHTTCIENLLLKKCRASSHIAIQTLWILEANYLDSIKNFPNAESTVYAKHLVHYFHQSIFKPKQGSPYQSPSDTSFDRKPLHVPSAIVGIGAIFASLACPQMYQMTREIIQYQSKKDGFLNEKSILSPQTSFVDSDLSSLSCTPIQERKSVSIKGGSNGGSMGSLNVPSYNELGLSNGLSNGFSNRLGVNTQLHPQPQIQTQNSIYFYSQTQFLLTLVDISIRLTTVPKEARQGTLVAELTLLNHTLPADICLPLWCRASANHPNHHRIARISPIDAVVLNSAERVPYLIFVEILNSSDSDNNGMTGSGSIDLISKRVFSSSNDSTPISTPMGSPRLKPVLLNQTTSELELFRNVSLANKYLSTRDYSESNPNLAESSENLKKNSSRSFMTHEDIEKSMKAAAVMLAQLYNHQNSQPSINSTQSHSKSASNSGLKSRFDDIRNKLIQEMMELEAVRVSSFESHMGDLSLHLENKSELQPKEELDKEDPSAAVFKELWSLKKERIRSSSPYGSDPNWNLVSVIVKSGADLRQEQLALQLIYEMSRIWKLDGVPVWVYNFKMLIISDQSGLIETIQDAISIHSIKKQGIRLMSPDSKSWSLYEYYRQEFKTPESFEKAQECFLKSLAGYSIICYLLQIKDRHNGNILVDNQGHVIHIDFGFMLSNSPGSVGFELAPFKFPMDYIEILGGIDSPMFSRFIDLCTEAFLSLRKRADWIVGLVEMMEHNSRLPCFTGITKPKMNPNAKTQEPKVAVPSKSVSMALKERMQLKLSDTQVAEYVKKLVQSSANNSFTILYDTFQVFSTFLLLYDFYSIMRIIFIKFSLTELYDLL